MAKLTLPPLAPGEDETLRREGQQVGAAHRHVLQLGPKHF